MAIIKNRGKIPSKGELAIVAGAGRSGVAAARLLRNLGANVRLVDNNPDALAQDLILDLQKDNIDVVLGSQDSKYFVKASHIITSPGFPIRNLVEMFKNAGLDSNPEIVSETEMAWRCLDTEKIIAVTGTSGKTTTTSLAAEIMKTQGFKVFLGGNIGIPLSEYVLENDKADVLVLELSSFQLQGCNSFSPNVALILNITPNHLDYHKDMAEYVKAKFNIVRFQEKDDFAILGLGVKDFSSQFTLRSQVLWLGETGSFSRSRLLGEHNKINIEAAWQACKLFGVSRENAEKAVADFSPLPHRLELVGDIDGTLFINDSKCTTVSSLKVALASFDRPVRLLCGGKYKGGDLTSLNNLIREKVCEVAIFGASRDKFESAWNGIVPMHWHKNLAEAMASLNKSKNPNDVILLSPATSSFDQYANYEKRGEDFKGIFNSLKNNIEN